MAGVSHVFFFSNDGSSGIDYIKLFWRGRSTATSHAFRSDSEYTQYYPRISINSFWWHLSMQSFPHPDVFVYTVQAFDHQPSLCPRWILLWRRFLVCWTGWQVRPRSTKPLCWFNCRVKRKRSVVKMVWRFSVLVKFTTRCSLVHDLYLTCLLYIFIDVASNAMFVTKAMVLFL